MKKYKMNSGSMMALFLCIINSLLMPLMPDIIRKIIIGMDVNITIPLDYWSLATYWGIFLLFIWIPTGIIASIICRKNGVLKSFIFIVLMFLIILFILGFILRILIN